MLSNWDSISLSDVGRIVTGRTPPGTKPEQFGGSTPFVTPTDMDGRRTIIETQRRLSESGVHSVRKAKIPRRSVMVSCIGSRMGKTAIAGDNCVTNQQINSIVVGEDYDPRFIYYNLSAREDELRTLAGGSAQPILNKSSFARLEIEAPPLSEQRAIANILSTLDDKIELNREMNRTLEAAAQAIFRSWFVDFDPVVAKTDGRKPFGLSDEIAALFPNRFIESEMGPIPEGWKVSTIGDSVETVGGSTPSTKEPSFWDDGDIHWATPKDLSGQTHSVLLETRRKITEAGVGKISSGLLPTGTVLMSSRAPVGYLAINEVPLAVNQGFIAMKCNGDLGNHYILQWAAQEMDEIKSRAGGTTFAEISKRAFRPIPIIAPKKQIHDSWHRLADTLHAKVVHNLRESQTLAALRDLLLPKLLSGEIRVAEAERELEEAGV